MKISDLYEYNMGIQGKDANAKSKVDEPEIDVPGDEMPEPEAEDNNIEKKLAQGSRKVGAMAGKKIQGNQFAAGAGKIEQGKMPNKTELKQLAPVIGDVTNAMTNPKFANRLGALLKQAGKEGVDESTLAKKILKKLTGKKPGKGIRKRSRLLQEANPQLFEINFNKKEIAKEALDLPIRCGFEAETLWRDLDSSSGSDDIDNLSYSEVEDEIRISGNDQDYIADGFSEWITEYKTNDYLPDIVEDWIQENKEDEEYLNDFIDSSDGPSSEAVERYKKEFEDTDPKEYENREEDGWEYMNWVREYVEEEYDEIYLEWLREVAETEDDLRQQAFDVAYDDFSYDEWINDMWGSMGGFLDDYGIDYSSFTSGGLAEVASEMQGWAEESSSFSGYVDYGSYGTTTTSGWAVEDDSSIEGSGCGAEIISPVYNTPREMLKEMGELFKSFEERNVETNNSTGLHVTMSWNGEAGGYDGPNHASANKVKMASLLGDQYLLSTFGRQNNSYTKSQEKSVRKAAQNVKLDDKRSLENMENIVSKGIDSGKFVSINFKSEKDNDSGYNLIEFRIGGGDDYHTDISKIIKAVVRYATVMEAGHTPKYDNDYARALVKSVNTAGKLSDRDLERGKSTVGDIESPIVGLIQSLISKDKYLDTLSFISNAVKSMREYEELSDKGADKRWKQSIKDYEKKTGKKVQIKEVETVYGDLAVQPDPVSPSLRAEKLLKKAQGFYTKAIGNLAVDVTEEKHRAPINAKSIGIIRNSLKEFKLDLDTFPKMIQAHLDSFNIQTQNDRPDQQFAVLKKGIDILFKKDILGKPTFLKLPQIDSLVSGLWSAVTHLNKGTDSAKELKALGELVGNMTLVSGTDYEDDLRHNQNQSWQTIINKREFNDFYSSLTRGGYNSSTVLLPTGGIYNKDAMNKVVKQLKTYPHYNEPVSPEHNRNIHNDDSYVDNFLNKYMMMVRKRFIHWQESKEENLQLYLDSIKAVGKLLKPLYEALKDAESDTAGDMGISNYLLEKFEALVNDIETGSYQSDPFGEHIVARISDVVTDVLRTSLDSYYTKKLEGSSADEGPLGKIRTKRFNAIRDWMRGFDKISTQLGFSSQEDEIADKRNIDDREQKFDKNIRNNNRPKLELPGHSFAYIQKDFYEKIEQNSRYAQANKNAFSNQVNKGGRVFVIPAAHWSQANEAIEVIDLLNSLKDYPLGTSQEWRRKGCQKILKEFRKQYGIHLPDLMGTDSKYIHIGATEMRTLKSSNVEIAHTDEDSREPHVEPLVSKEELSNPKSKEPFDRGSATMWALDDAENSKELERFKAHDWTGWEEEDKKKVLAYMGDDYTGSFHRAYDKFQQEDIANKQTASEDLINAAGVMGMEDNSSGFIGRHTNWSNLAKQLNIEAGVNDQGVNLLKKVYEQLDAQVTADRPGIGMERWAGCINDAVKYIKKNYMVSGGNYFRKDADGNVGDDVSDVYSPPRTSGEPDYDKARADWPGFDRMMQRGIQNHLSRGETNNLVDFLNNPNNDEVFKANVLGTITNRGDMENGPFASFQDALAVTRRRNNESVNEAVPQTRFGMTDYQEIFAFINDNRSLGSINLQLALMREYDITKHEARGYMRNERTYSDVNIDKHRSRNINTTMENVFENFEDLTLDQQLEIIRNDKISESLADITAARLRKQQGKQSFKQEMVTIWDNRPWPLPGSYSNKQLIDLGFKRFAGGWKVTKDKYDAIANPVRKTRVESLQVTDMLIKAKRLSENLPNNNKIDIIKDILSKDFPAGDIDIQFKAFTALPIPRMMTDFSRLHSGQGPSADGRDILKHYVKTRMSDQDIKKLKLNENKDDLVAKIEAMPDDDTTRKLVNYVEQLIADLGVGGRIQSLSKNLEDIPDEDVQKSIRQIAKIVASVDMTPEQRAKLFVDWKADNLVNVDALLSPTTVTMNDIYVGYNQPHVKELVDDLQEVVQYGIGPGEFALAVLSQRISGMGASAGEDGGKGDLVVDGKPVELKTTRKNAARFNDREVTTSNEYKSLVTQFFTKYAEKIAELESTGTKVKVGSGMQQAHVAAFLKAVPEAQDEIGNIISNIFTNLPPIGGKIAVLLKSGDINGAMQLIAQANVNNYLAKKRQSGNLAGILFIDLKKQTFNFIEDVNDLEGSGLRLHAKTNYLVTTNENPFANTSIVPTTRNVSEGKQNKPCPRTKAPVCYCGSVNNLTEAEETVHAYCEFEHGEITGAVNLQQEPGQATRISGKVEGLEPGEHGFHIHEFGDLSDGCDSAGGHYNPDGVDHGDLEKGHVGDLGNITADENGIAQFDLVAERVELRGDRSVVGRAIVVHKDKDDLGKGGDDESLKTGNAGERAGCGVIRLKNMNENNELGTGTVKDLSTMAGGLYKRQQMPQLKMKHLNDRELMDTYGIESKPIGNIGIDKLKPSQIDGRQDYISNISKEIVQFLRKNPTRKIKDYLAGKPFIVDYKGFIVNGHHRYWAIRNVTDKPGRANTTRIPVIFVNKSIQELVQLFGPGGDALDLTSKKKGLSIVKPDTKDPQTARYQQELDLRMNRSNSAKQGWLKRKETDPRQKSFNFDKETEKEE